MIEHLSTDEAFKQRALKTIRERQVSKLLFILRCKANLSQKEMAEKIGCTQSRISKIEGSRDEDLSVKDLLDYAKALKLRLEIGYGHPSFKLVDQIKFHAFKMKEGLERLCELAKDDPEMTEGVRKFFGEAFVNVLSLITESYKKLPKKGKAEEKSTIQVSAPVEIQN
jgi:transcriptional regulator with XRE-family HTH domain